MVIFCQILAEIGPDFVEKIPGATGLERISFLQEKCSTAPTDTDGVTFLLVEDKNITVSCKSTKSAVFVEKSIERLIGLDVPADDSLPRGKTMAKTTTKGKSKRKKVVVKAEDIKREDKSMEEDSDSEHNDGDDDEEEGAESAGRPKAKRARSKLAPNVRYIEYRKITTDEYREEGGKMHCVRCDYMAPTRKRIIEHIRRKHDVPQFECQHCDKKFKTRSDYNKHQKSHPEAQTSTQFVVKNRRPDLCCKKCNKTFATLREWATHRESVHKIPTDISQYETGAGRKGYHETAAGKYVCNQCVFETGKKRYITAHIRRQHDMVFRCPFCEKRFSKRATCAAHIATHTYCRRCGRAMKSKEELAAHALSAHAQDGDAGDGDGDGSGTEEGEDGERRPRWLLWGLMDAYVETPERCVCRLCGHVAPPPAAQMEAHIAEAHEADAYVCTICTDTTTGLAAFNRHLAAHIREEGGEGKAEAFTCTACGKAYNSKTTLKIHMEQVHKADGGGGGGDTAGEATASNSDSQEPQQPGEGGAGEAGDGGEKQPLRCPHCPYVGHLTKYLNEHILRRHGEKKFQCPHCPKRFSTKSVFNVHKQRHTRAGVSPKAKEEEAKVAVYSCPVCRKEFSTRLTLGKHIEQKHPGHERADVGGEGEGGEAGEAAPTAGDATPRGDAEVFPCRLCGKIYSSTLKLRHHLNQNHQDEKVPEAGEGGEEAEGAVGGGAGDVSSTGGAELRCPYCEYVGTVIRNFNDHIVRRHGEKKHGCPHCEKRFSTRSAYNSHVKTHAQGVVAAPEEGDEGKIYTCPICAKVYASEPSFRTHMGQAHPDYEYSQDGSAAEELPIQAVCPVCKMAYRYKDSYLAHLERMHPEHSQDTIEEGYTLAKDDSIAMDTVENSAVVSLDQAILDLVDAPTDDSNQSAAGAGAGGAGGGKVKLIKCSKCDYTARTARYLNDHMGKQHGEKVLQCPHCPKTYCSKSQLTQHVKVHSDRYCCDHCGKELGSVGSLNMHVRMVHEGQKRKPADKKQCPYCPMMLADGYESHVNKHQGVFPYECKVCGKRFPGRYNLAAHERTHSGKIYPCDECGSELSSRSHLLRHMKLHENSA